MARGDNLTGIEFGKVRVFSSSDDLGKVYEIFAEIMKKQGYPADDRVWDLDELDYDEEYEEEEEESEDVLIEDDSSDIKSSPWMKAATKKSGGTDGQA